MTISMSAYFDLRNEFISRCAPCTDENLQMLKNNFKNIIKSTRRWDNVANIGELVRLLEKRNAVYAQNLDCLKDIARILNRHELLQLLSNGLGLHTVIIPPPPPVQQRQGQQHVQQAPVLNSPPAAYHERIYELIIDQIGLKWKYLARNLNIGEGKIDELQDQYRSEPSERVREILRYHERNTPPHEVWTRLMDALTSSRRNDLRNEVQRILIGN